VRRVLVEVRTTASPERVWRALTDPAEVSAWDGVEPLTVPAGYPLSGQHARWRTRVGPIPLVLHDRVTTVEPGRRLASVIDVGYVHLEEEYRLVPAGGGTVLVSDNGVRARVPGLGHLAAWTARRAIEASMVRLRRHCEAGDERRG
jgi:uncharacterized protein YndB with AHSA1/START domain